MANLLVPPFWDWSPSLIDDRAAAMVSTGSPIIIPGWPDWTAPRTLKGQVGTIKAAGGGGNGPPAHEMSPHGPLWRFKGQSGTANAVGTGVEFDNLSGDFQVGTGPFTIMCAFKYLGTNNQINVNIAKGVNGAAQSLAIFVNTFATGDGKLFLSINASADDLTSAAGLISAGDYGVAIGTRDPAGNTSLWWRGVEVASGTGSTRNVNNSQGVSIANFGSQTFFGNFQFLIGGLWERALINAEKTLLSFDPLILIRPDMAKLLPAMITAPAAGSSIPIFAHHYNHNIGSRV